MELQHGFHSSGKRRRHSDQLALHEAHGYRLGWHEVQVSRDLPPLVGLTRPCCPLVADIVGLAHRHFAEQYWRALALQVTSLGISGSGTRQAASAQIGAAISRLLAPAPGPLSLAGFPATGRTMFLPPEHDTGRHACATQLEQVRAA